MTIEEYMEEHRKRVDNMTLAQARDLIAKTLTHSNMEIEFDKAVWMLLECADEAIQNKVPEKVQQAYEDGKKDGYVSAKVDAIRNSEWIPVTERLPEEYTCDDGYIEPSDAVLVQVESGLMYVSRYWSRYDDLHVERSCWIDLDSPNLKVIAWMPLPQPYKAESEVEE